MVVAVPAPGVTSTDCQSACSSKSRVSPACVQRQ